MAVAVGLAARAPIAEAIPRDDAEGGGVVIAGLETEWHAGQGELHMGSVFNNGNGGWGLLAESDVMWTDEAGTGTPPRPGKMWFGAAHIAVFDPFVGHTGVEFVVSLPPATTFAIDANHGISCTKIPKGADITEIDVTADPAYNCPAAPTRTAEGWSLGTRQVPQYTQFVITFPLKSTVPLLGASGPGPGHRLTVSVRPQFGETKQPWVFVGAPILDPARFLHAILRCAWDNPSNPGPC